MTDEEFMTDAEEYVRLAKQLKAIKLKMEKLEETLIATIGAGGEFAVPKKKVVIKGRNRKVLKDERLKDTVTSEVWEAITVRKTDSLLLKLALRNGDLNQEDLDSATDMSKTWLEVK